MNFAEQLKSQLNIVEVVEHYLRLKRQGAGPRYVGLCPFHSEKTPSFGVHSTLEFYNCFGCGASGDVLKFVQQMETLTFPETLRVLAERYGIAMPEWQRGDDPESQRQSVLYEMQDAAADIFQQNLRSAVGADARQYLKSRNVTQAAIDEFRLGLSDSSSQQLVQKLKKYGPALLEESGLVSNREEGGGPYDRFRGRLMFPIHDAEGRVVGFGARALRENEKVKYLNSPATKLYNKSLILYNLHRAKIDARKHDRMILVEGYMDVIGVYSAGFREVIATCGTKLGSEQIRSIKRQISQQQSNRGQVIFNFDPDPAGEKSTEKYISAVLAEGLRVKVLEIPGQLDPDEYIQQNGAEAYGGLLERANSYFHWLAERARGRFDMRTAEGRIDALKVILPAIEQIHDRLERAAIAREVAEYLSVDRDTLRQTMRPGAGTQPTPRPRNVSSAVPPNEKLLLACVLASADARAVIRHYLSTSQDLHILELKSIFEAILAIDSESSSFSLAALSSKLEPRLQDILSEISFSDSTVREEDAAEQALHCLNALEAKSHQAKREKLRRQIRELEGRGNFAEALQLATELDRA